MESTGDTAPDRSTRDVATDCALGKDGCGGRRMLCLRAGAAAVARGPAMEVNM
jgi:hypothetical protein